MTIETEHLILRQWKEEDLEPLAKLCADPRVMEFWEIKSFEAAQKEYGHFVSSIEENGWGFWAVERRENHQFIGLIPAKNSELKS